MPAGSYSLSAGELSIAQNMTIAGAGARTTVIDQTTANARAFDIQPGVTAMISGLEAEFGKTTANSTNGNFGGNVLNRGTLTLSEDWVVLGQTTGGSGGGIANLSGTLTVTHSLLQDNSSFSGGAGGGDIQRGNRIPRDADRRQHDDRQQHRVGGRRRDPERVRQLHRQ